MPWSEGGRSPTLGVSQLATGGAPILDGRRRPSFGGTSRMTRECHVRICERLGVKFPGPTRQNRTTRPGCRTSVSSQRTGHATTAAACSFCAQQRPHTCSNRRRGRQRRGPKHNPQIGRGRLSEAEPQSDRGGDVVALEKAGGQSAIHLREHDPGIEIPPWCKPPIDSGRNPVECPGTLRVFGTEAGGGSPGSGAKKEFWI